MFKSRVIATVIYVIVSVVVSGLTTIICSGQWPDRDFNLTRMKSASNQPDFSLHNQLPHNQSGVESVDMSVVRYLPTPADAVAYALADVATLQRGDQPFQRYIWIPDGSKDSAAAVNFTINIAWSRATPLIRCQTVAAGRLVRLDLRKLAPRSDIGSKDFTDIFKLWEQLAFEPYFHIVRTTEDALPTNARLIRSLDDDPPGSQRFKIGDETWYRSPTGKTFCLVNGVWQPRKLEFKRNEKVAVAGAHVGLEQHVMLQGLTQSNAPVVRYDWFIKMSLTTIDGGLYYDLLGLERNPKGQTAQQAFLAKFGASEERVSKLRADERAAIFKSNVTGRPRRIDVFYGEGVRPSAGLPLVTITHDVGDGVTNVESDPIRNLLDFKDRAREIIVHRANGLHAFALFDGNGTLQNSAPDDVVKDHTIPVPYPARLQPAISCIRCHGQFDGYPPFNNDVKLLLSGHLDVFGDLSGGQKPTQDVIDRLAGLYAGDLRKPIQRGRDDYSDAVFIVTGGMSVPQTSQVVSRIFADYYYTDVDALIACRELGYDVPPDKAAQYLNVIIPPLQRDILGISPEDPILGALKMNMRVQRYQWESVYADAAFRAMQSKTSRSRTQQPQTRQPKDGLDGKNQK